MDLDASSGRPSAERLAAGMAASGAHRPSYGPVADTVLDTPRPEPRGMLDRIGNKSAFALGVVVGVVLTSVFATVVFGELLAADVISL
jgi:hypothetical protein